jgi:hyperosmotically inducible protein
MKVKSTAFLLIAAVAQGLGGAASATVTDSRIESAAAKSYVFKNDLKNDDVKVESKDGAVVLTGTVAEDSHKRLAKDTVEDLPGVKSVDDRLEVRGAAPAERSDAWITGKVKGVLLFHRSVSAVDTEVDTKDGVVTLRGRADNAAQKDLTGEYAKDVDGVKSVDNRLAVAASQKPAPRRLERRMDDASITARVKSALLFHRSTSALRTSVKTKNGVVVLSGKAQNGAERDLVEKLVKDIEGVKGVRNRMTVQ